ncbi:cytochrome o ubiquinol oxidase subunit IV [Xanthobacter sediminis]
MSAQTDEVHGSHGSMGRLMTGATLATILTVIPFVLVMGEAGLGRTALIGIIMGLGALQVIVHLLYFLGVNRNSEEGWTLASAIFSAIILVIVLAGSLWVMHNMDENMMPMPQMDHGMNLHAQQG